jgi:hypothetical protein
VFYRSLFDNAWPRGGAQMMATALNIYATTQGLGGSAALVDGFHVTTTGLGARSFNLGADGAPFGVPNGTTLTVIQILSAANQQAVNGVPWPGNEVLRRQAHQVFARINEAGEIDDGSDWSGEVDAFFASGGW